MNDKWPERAKRAYTTEFEMVGNRRALEMGIPTHYTGNSMTESEGKAHMDFVIKYINNNLNLYNGR